MKLNRPHFSPPSTDSNRKLVWPSSSRRNSESGVSMSARISRTTGTQFPRLASSSKDFWDGRSTAGSEGPARPGGGGKSGGGSEAYQKAYEPSIQAVEQARPRARRLTAQADELVHELGVDAALAVLRDLHAEQPALAARQIFDEPPVGED